MQKTQGRHREAKVLDETGARRQESLRTPPPKTEVTTFPYPLKGIVDAVYYVDSNGNAAGQTVVDVQLLFGYPKILKVPVCTGKINKDHGEEWTPDPGDGVVVQFINGNWHDPIVTGYYRLPHTTIQATKADAPAGKRRYHRKCNETDLVIDKDGNRTEYIAKDETVVIQGSETVTVQTGDVTVDVQAGKCTVHIKGKTVWQSEGTVDIDGTNTGAVKGIVQGDCICPYTRKPHIMVSASVRGSK